MNTLLLILTLTAAAAPPTSPPVPAQSPAAAPAPPIGPVGPAVKCSLDALGRLTGAAKPMLEQPPNPAAQQSAKEAWDDIVAARMKLQAGDVAGAWRVEKSAHKHVRAALNPVWGRAAVTELQAPLGEALDCLYQRIQLTQGSLGTSAVYGAANEHARAASAYGEARAMYQAGDLRMAYLKAEDAHNKLDRAAAKVWHATEAP